MIGNPQNKLQALDLCCKAGGASMGLHRAGFQVFGVDIEPQPRYPFKFLQRDALSMPNAHLASFDFIWASPHCQRYTALGGREDLSHYPDQVADFRALLIGSGVPYAIENVVGAPLRADLVLCANSFGLRSYRHRVFECSFPVVQPPHPPHKVRVNRRGENRRQHWANGGHITVTGDIGTYIGPEALGIDWMNGNELSQAVPPAFSEYVARQFLAWRKTAPVPRGPK